MEPTEYAKRIGAAVSQLDKMRATEICNDLITSLPERDAAFPVKPAKSILSTMRRKRYFDLMCRVSDALISNGQDSLQIRRQYGQALIDSGHLNPALAVLKEIVAEPQSQTTEMAEALGLIGRVYKQRYVNCPNATDAKKQQMICSAIESYKHVYDSDRQQYLWHGINVAALVARAERDGVPSPIDDDFREIAKHIRDAIEEKDDGGNATLWDYGTAMEAAVALGDIEGARTWASAYVAAGADAFELCSTLRQLDEVWNINFKEEFGQQIVPLLQASLLEVQHGSLSFPAARFLEVERNAGDLNLERVFGDDTYKRIKWLQMGLDRCHSIGLVARRDGTGVGTGFAVQGRSLSNRLDDDWYFLTNSHVITDDDEVIRNSSARYKPLRPQDAIITFELQFDPEHPEFGVSTPAVWTSPPHELDASLMRLTGSFPGDRVHPYPIERDLPATEGKKRIYIAGHPGGRGLTVSLHDNHLLEYNDWLMHYRTPTDPGSSGSPVFNDQWELVGLHHAGSSKKQSLNDPAKSHEANEGIRIGAIMDRIDS